MGCVFSQHSLPSPDDQDIEELCQLCTPPSESSEIGVTRYPIKVEKKKAREELDIVCVIEWRSTGGDRWFLLSKRPETGLLAGLHDFPSRPNITSSASDPVALRTIAYEIIEDVLVHPPARPPSNNHFSKTKLRAPALVPKNNKKDEPASLSVKKIELAGDVLHIFSHIRKTYRVQWVLLEGGSKLPELSELAPNVEDMEDVDVGDEDTRPKAKKTKVVKGKSVKSGASSRAKTNASSKNSKQKKEPGLRWVKYEDVEKAK